MNKRVFLGSDKNPFDHAVNEERLNHVCRGNDAAKQFLVSYAEFAHMLDDAVDGELAGNGERAGVTAMNFVMNLLVNPFVEKYKGSLIPIMVQGINTWQDANIAAKHEDIRIRFASDILKSVHSDIVFQVAYHVGGWDHMREVSRLWRTFDFDIVEETKPE